MAGKENSGIEFADASLFRGAVWFLTPIPGQKFRAGRIGEYVAWIQKIGAKIEVLDADAHQPGVTVQYFVALAVPNGNFLAVSHCAVETLLGLALS